jgi:hypothetical protein
MPARPLAAWATKFLGNELGKELMKQLVVLEVSFDFTEKADSVVFNLIDDENATTLRVFEGVAYAVCDSADGGLEMAPRSKKHPAIAGLVFQRPTHRAMSVGIDVCIAQDAVGEEETVFLSSVSQTVLHPTRHPSDFLQELRRDLGVVRSPKGLSEGIGQGASFAHGR